MGIRVFLTFEQTVPKIKKTNAFFQKTLSRKKEPNEIKGIKNQEFNAIQKSLSRDVMPSCGHCFWRGWQARPHTWSQWFQTRG